MENDANSIDLVYLWVDGNDPAWQAKRNAFIGKLGSSSVNCKGRYANNDEFKYSLRSVDKYLPWIRKIFIVTDEQTPEWLDVSNPRVQIVDHKDFMPAESLPCFNSCLIEHYLYRISGLSERFLYANDDMYINKEATAADFFGDDGFPIVRLTHKRLRKIRWFYRENIRRTPLRNYSKKIAHASQLVNEKYGVYYTGMPHHNIDAYLTEDCRHVAEDVMHDEFMADNKHKMRNDKDVQRIVFSYVALAEKRAHLKYVNKGESMLVKIHRKGHYEKLERYNPMFFCMNDSEYATDSDRLMAKTYLENRFNEKSSFEK